MKMGDLWESWESLVARSSVIAKVGSGMRPENSHRGCGAKKMKIVNSKLGPTYRGIEIRYVSAALLDRRISDPEAGSRMGRGSHY